MRLRTHLVLLIALLPTSLASAIEPPPSENALEFFERRVRPILSEHCHECHGAAKQEAGLRLDSAAAAARGSDSGPVIVAGQPDESLLIQVVRYDGDIQMPPESKLSDSVIETLSAWIESGAAWPQSSTTAAPEMVDARKEHWAFQPVQLSPLPSVEDSTWVS